MLSHERALGDFVTSATGHPFRLAGSRPLGGGCIHDARQISGEDGRSYFVKENTASLLPSFEAEAYALERMAETETIRVPRPVGAAEVAGRAVLVLEFLPIGGRGDWYQMGCELACMHQSQSGSFGWPTDNWIGSSPQKNGESADWVPFYRERRLLPQIEWARQKGLRLNEAERLMENLEGFFTSYDPLPSLLHGDLWAGNAGFLTDGTPVLYDPAAYFGDREADLALTELFGGFPKAFHEGYDATWERDPGYSRRRDLYNLYHVLNHYNLFGGGYGSQAESMVHSLLRGVS